VKSSLSVEVAKGLPLVEVSLVVELNLTSKVIDTCDLNLTLPKIGKPIPPGAVKEYLVLAVTPLEFLRVMDSRTPLLTLNFSVSSSSRV